MNKSDLNLNLVESEMSVLSGNFLLNGVVEVKFFVIYIIKTFFCFMSSSFFRIFDMYLIKLSQYTLKISANVLIALSSEARLTHFSIVTLKHFHRDFEVTFFNFSFSTVLQKKSFCYAIIIDLWLMIALLKL